MGERGVVGMATGPLRFGAGASEALNRGGVRTAGIAWNNTLRTNAAATCQYTFGGLLAQCDPHSWP